MTAHQTITANCQNIFGQLQLEAWLRHEQIKLEHSQRLIEAAAGSLRGRESRSQFQYKRKQWGITITVRSDRRLGAPLAKTTLIQQLRLRKYEYSEMSNKTKIYLKYETETNWMAVPSSLLTVKRLTVIILLPWQPLPAQIQCYTER